MVPKSKCAQQNASARACVCVCVCVSACACRTDVVGSELWDGVEQRARVGTQAVPTVMHSSECKRHITPGRQCTRTHVRRMQWWATVAPRHEARTYISSACIHSMRDEQQHRNVEDSTTRPTRVARHMQRSTPCPSGTRVFPYRVLPGTDGSPA